jgi:type I restriction-modification system DNA methylase subunit
MDFKKAFVNFFKTSKPPTQRKPYTPKPYIPTTERPKPKEPPPPAKEDIPQKLIKEKSKNPTDHKKEFVNTFKKLSYRHSPWTIWTDFVTMFACSISNSFDKHHYEERESLYLKTITRYDKEEQNLFPELVVQTVLALDDNPEQDFLGSIFMDLKLGNDHGGQFFTPYHISRFMAAVTIQDDLIERVKTDGYITICDPTCGSGVMLIAAANEAKTQLKKEGLNYQNHILFAAQDIDFTVAMMCYIQLSLLGVAAYIKVGNSLTNPISPTDTLENYWFTPIYFSDVWVTRRMISNLKGKKNE